MERDVRVHQVLLQVSDPRAAPVDSANPSLSAEQWQRLFTLAGAHGVAGILLRNLGKPCDANHDAWLLAQRFLRAKAVQALRLRRYGEELLDRFAAAGVRAVEFKGADFAERLYPPATPRPTSDIDLLVPRSHWSDAADVLGQLGYVKLSVPPMRFPADDYGEQTWRHHSAAEIEVDLHWNLINHPSVRRRASVEYADLDWEATGQAGVGRVSATPSTRLTIAAAHATFGHQFDRLLLLCDIREACRQLTESDVSDLRKIAARTGMRPALDLALGTTARFFNDPCSAQLQKRLSGRTIALAGSRLISAKMLLCSGGHGHWLRRRLLRELLKRAA